MQIIAKVFSNYCNLKATIMTKPTHAHPQRNRPLESQREQDKNFTRFERNQTPVFKHVLINTTLSERLAHRYCSFKFYLQISQEDKQIIMRKIKFEPH